MGRNRGSRWMGFVEGLESRAVCNGSWGSAVAAEVSALSINLGITIKGTIHGTVTSITPLSTDSDLVTYTAVAKANIVGDGHGSGSHIITSKPAKNKTTNDTYSQGLLTLTGTTDEVKIAYTGTGHTQANGSFTATLKGHAASVAGEHAGLSGTFTASISGNNRTGTFLVSFTIKL